MPKVVSVWCRRLGHRTTCATCYGQTGPLALLPDDLEVEFISATTQASGLNEKHGRYQGAERGHTPLVRC